jgi:hypothetical protein
MKIKDQTSKAIFFENKKKNEVLIGWGKYVCKMPHGEFENLYISAMLKYPKLNILKPHKIIKRIIKDLNKSK